MSKRKLIGVNKLKKLETAADTLMNHNVTLDAVLSGRAIYYAVPEGQAYEVRMSSPGGSDVAIKVFADVDGEYNRVLAEELLDALNTF